MRRPAPLPLLLFAAWALQTACALPRVFNIVDYGAIGDNITVNTAAIQATIDAAAAAGGGHVLVPPGGSFRTATISLRSDVYLLLPEGANLQGSSNLSDYTSISTDWDQWDVLHTAGALRTGVLGSMDGSGTGGTLSGPMWSMIDGYSPDQNQFLPHTWAGQFGCKGECRPRLLVFVDCSKVTIANIRLVDSADWTSLYRRTHNVLLENVTVWGSQYWPNNDGVDFESCINVTVRNWTSSTGDDGIVLGSGNCNDMRVPWPEPYGNYTPTRNVLIDGAIISSYSSAIKWEGIFQAWHGDVTDVVVRNVLIHDSARGIGLQQRTGGGVWANVRFDNVTVLRTKGITGSNWWGYGEALWITTLPENDAASPLGGIHNLSFVDCVFEGEQGGVVMARDQRSASAPTGITALSFANVSLVIGIYGNATRPGVHDYRPQDALPDHVHWNVTGWWFEHVDDVNISGGLVRFDGPMQRFWQPATCRDGTPDSNVTQMGMACTPAA